MTFVILRWSFVQVVTLTLTGIDPLGQVILTKNTIYNNLSCHKD